jgi:NADPH-dependent 2,4-dienoyl-CoA reductase/sulfur reductase-like enzyme
VKGAFPPSAIWIGLAIRKRVECDAVAFGFGLKPETQLADLAGIPFRYDKTFRQWLPVADGDGRAGARTYLAGDGFTIGGAQAANISGMLAAAALLEDVGTRMHNIDRSALRRQLARLRCFQRGPRPWVSPGRRRGSPAWMITSLYAAARM